MKFHFYQKFIVHHKISINYGNLDQSGNPDLKGIGLCIIAFRHLLRFARVLNNTEVKGHYSTICRHACLGILRLINAAWYTSKYVAALYLYT